MTSKRGSTTTTYSGHLSQPDTPDIIIASIMDLKRRSRDLLRTIGGILFAFLIIPITWLMFVGISKLIRMIVEVTPNNPLAIFPAVLLFLLLIVIAAISKTYIGGNPLQIISKRGLERGNGKPKQVGQSNGRANLVLIKSYLLFLFISFVDFAITIGFISKHILWSALFSTLLNIIPIYLIWNYLVRKLNSGKISVAFWVTTMILSVLLVIPYGEFVLDFAIGIFKRIAGGWPE